MKNKQAFSLVEAMTGLLILGMIMGLLQLGVALVKDAQISNKPANYSWIQFIHNIETQQKPFYWQRIEGNGTVLNLWRNNRASDEEKEYILKLTKRTNTLYLSGSQGGYMPLIYNVKSVKFKKINNNVRIDIVFFSGEHRNAILAINEKK